ncbi:MAG: hypothetical protein AAFR38_12665 [Planctomycetota bacterium]
MSMRHSFAVGALAAATIAGSADAQIFQRHVGTEDDERIFDAAPTRDGGYITAGFRARTNIGPQFLITRYHSSGSVFWQREFGGDGVDIAYSVQQTEDGGFIVAGESTSFSPPTIGSPLEIVLLRLDASGNQIWANAYTGSFGDDPLHRPLPGVALDQGPNGRIFVVGSLRNAALAMAVGPNGAPIWQRVYFDPTGPTGLPGSLINFTDIVFDDGVAFPGGPVVEPSLLISGSRFRNRQGDAPFPGLNDFPFPPPIPPGPTTGDFDAALVRLNLGGDPIFAFGYDFGFGPPSPDNRATNEFGHGLDLSDFNTIVLGGDSDLGPQFPAGQTGTHTIEMNAIGTPFASRNSIGFASSPPVTDTNISMAYAALKYDEMRQAIVYAGTAELLGGITGGRLTDNALLHQMDLGSLSDRAMASYGDLSFISTGQTVVPNRACGYLLGGDIAGEMPPIFGRRDDYLVKTDSLLRSGCLEIRFDPFGFDEVRQFQYDLASPFLDGIVQLPDLVERVDFRNDPFCFDFRCDGNPFPCSPADLAPPFGVISNADVTAFVNGFFGGDPRVALLAFPHDIISQADVDRFVVLFFQGCP